MGMGWWNSWDLNFVCMLSLWPRASLAFRYFSDWHPINTQIRDRNNLGLDFILASEGMNPGAADSGLLTICFVACEPQYWVLQSLSVLFLEYLWSKAYSGTSSLCPPFLINKMGLIETFFFSLFIYKTVKIQINDRISNKPLSFQKFSEIRSFSVPVTNKTPHARSWTCSTGEEMLTQGVTVKSAEVHTTFGYCE